MMDFVVDLESSEVLTCPPDLVKKPPTQWTGRKIATTSMDYGININ